MNIVIKQVPPSVKRGLMLMSKILQNIANHVEFSKEQHMLPFNDFLRAHFEIGRRWDMITKLFSFAENKSNLTDYAIWCKESSLG
jgi:hypothetical protein